MSERILIPLDGSKLGEAALHYVEDMVSKMSSEKMAEITLLQVITTLRHDVHVSGGTAGTITVPYNESELEGIKTNALKYLDNVGANLKNKGMAVSSKVVTGQDPADEIIKVEQEVNADLVAMSTHGRAGISRWAFGSVTDRVLRGGKVPVLMVRAAP